MCTIIFFATNKATSRGYRTRNFRPATHSRVESSQSQGIKGLTIGCRGRQTRPLASKVATYKPNGRDLPRRSSRPPTSEDATHTFRRRDPHRYRSRPIATQDAYKQKGSRVQETNRLHQTKVATPAYNIKSTTPPLCRPQSQRKQITTCSTIS